MKFNPSFQLRDVCGEHVLFASDAALVDFNRLITLNETAYDLYQAFSTKEFQLADVVSFLLQHYDDAPATKVESDVQRVLEQLKQEGVVLD